MPLSIHHNTPVNAGALLDYWPQTTKCEANKETTVFQITTGLLVSMTKVTKGYFALLFQSRRQLRLACYRSCWYQLCETQPENYWVHYHIGCQNGYVNSFI